MIGHNYVLSRPSIDINLGTSNLERRKQKTAEIGCKFTHPVIQMVKLGHSQKVTSANQNYNIKGSYLSGMDNRIRCVKKLIVLYA